MIPCPRVHLNLKDEWQQVRSIFHAVPPTPLRQAWREDPEPEFRPASVRCGRDDQALWIYAVLEDEDIRNPVQENHQPAFEFGDVFEIFLRPLGGTTYYELHVTPHHHIFQLRIPSSEAFYQQRNSGLNPDWAVLEPLFSSRVNIQAEKQQWQVLVRVEFAKLDHKTPPQPGTEWRISFSRYDYSQDRNFPVLSSTSHHTKIDFHRQEEWNRMIFDAEKII
ncbi:MAG: carbohydrate-binding family 9-like protein [Kiritimatiellia bacterium]